MIEDDQLIVHFFTVVELAAKIRVHPITIRRAIKSGHINALRTGKGSRSSYRIPSTEIYKISQFQLEHLWEKL